MNYLKRLLDPVIATGTVANILGILVILGVIGDVDVNNVTQIFTLLMSILVQLGIMKQPNETKKSGY